jgi:hypothetical protein
MSGQKLQYVVENKKLSYAFGLTWFVATDDEALRKQAADIISTSAVQLDLVICRDQDYQQFALGRKDRGIKSGTVSAAAVIASNIGVESWIYALEIEGRFWLCYGKTGYILPEGDRIFTDEEEAKREFLRLQPSLWKSISVPASWKEPNTFGEDRASFFQSSQVLVSHISDIIDAPTQKWMKLGSAANASSTIKNVALAAVLIGGAYVGYDFVFPKTTSPQIDVQAQTAEARRLLAERARAETEKKFQELDNNKPWTSLPLPEDFIQVCLDSIANVPVVAAKYTLAEVKCFETSISAAFNRQNGTYASWLKEWGSNQTLFDIDLTQDGSKAFLVSDYEKPAPRGEQEIDNYSYTSSVLTEAAMIEQAAMTISDPVTYTYEDFPEYIPIYGKSSISIDTTRPVVWQNTLKNVSGVNIKSITFNPTTMTYKFEGEIYVSNR